MPNVENVHFQNQCRIYTENKEFEKRVIDKMFIWMLFSSFLKRVNFFSKAGGNFSINSFTFPENI